MKKCKYDNLSNAEINRLVAERVLGWKYSPFTYKHDCKKELHDAWILPDKEIAEVLPYFTTSMDACLEHVVPAMREQGLLATILDKTTWSVEFLIGEHAEFRCLDKSLPRATCIAALMALDAMNKAEDPFD